MNTQRSCVAPTQVHRPAVAPAPGSSARGRHPSGAPASCEAIIERVRRATPALSRAARAQARPSRGSQPHAVGRAETGAHRSTTRARKTAALGDDPWLPRRPPYRQVQPRFRRHVARFRTPPLPDPRSSQGSLLVSTCLAVAVTRRCFRLHPTIALRLETKQRPLLQTYSNWVEV